MPMRTERSTPSRRMAWAANSVQSAPRIGNRASRARPHGHQAKVDGMAAYGGSLMPLSLLQGRCP